MKERFWMIVFGLATCIAMVGQTNSVSEGKQAPTERFVIPELVFEGGPVGRLIQKMRFEGKKSSPSAPPLNVIVAPGMAETQVPAFELRNVSYADVFEALNRLSDGKQTPRWAPSGGSDSPVWVLGEPASTFSPSPFGAVDPLTGMPLPLQPAPPVCEIYQLQSYLVQYKIEDITTAIQTAWKMLGADGGAQLKYHKDTNLLIAVGKPDQLQVIGQVLKSLNASLPAEAKAKSQTGEVSVNGGVNKPGALPLKPGEELTVLGAIARAGGLSVRANENKIRFTRPGVMEKTLTFSDLKKDKDISLRNGDIIEVAEKLF